MAFPRELCGKIFSRRLSIAYHDLPSADSPLNSAGEGVVAVAYHFDHLEREEAQLHGESTEHGYD